MKVRTDGSPGHEQGPGRLPEPRTGIERSAFFFHDSHTIKGPCFVGTIARLDLFGGRQGLVETR